MLSTCCLKPTHALSKHAYLYVLNEQSCPLCTGPRAYEVTLEVHMTGAGTVAVANKKIITEYTKTLQAAGLTVSMAPDDEFDNEVGEDGDGGGE